MSDQLDRLLNNARISLPGAIDSVIKLELFNAIDEFLKETDVWTEDIEFDITTTDVTSEVTEYEITSTGASLINRMLYVLDESNTGVAASMAEPGTIVLDRIPTAEATLTATVALTVMDPTTRDDFPQVPAWIVSQYYTEFLDGVLGRMMAQPAKSYSNERFAIVHLRKWRNAIALAKRNTNHKNIRGAQAWRFPKFA